MYLEVYVHGVGSSCNGEYFHHEVYHLVDNGVTLCGVYASHNNTWWRDTSGVTEASFYRIQEPRRGMRPDYDAMVICSRCAKKLPRCCVEYIIPDN